jgi:hypothetical protein
LQNRLIQTSQTGGQLYSDTSPFNIPWLDQPLEVNGTVILLPLVFPERKNTLAYFAAAFVTKKKVLIPVANVIKLFMAVSYDFSQ